jgi:CheY-like chemotaxis protein
VGSGEAAPRQAEVEATAGETILVVEDDVRVRRVSMRRLKEMGYVVIEAESGSAALEVLARGEPIDLLFTDVVMPGGMTGLELARQARSLRPGLKILFTSGYASPAAMKNEVPTGNAAWLSKPYSNADLGAKLWELLRR